MPDLLAPLITAGRLALIGPAVVGVVVVALLAYREYMLRKSDQ